MLPHILTRAGTLPARHPRDGEPLARGVVLVAPPDRHLAVDGGRARLLAGPKESGHRPAADVLLRSVAGSNGSRGAGVILSGTMDDGAAGLRAVRAAGGLALVQDPAQAAFPGMPRAAIEEADPQLIAPVAVLASRLCTWLHELPEDSPEIMVDTSDPEPAKDDLTALTCPECGGALWLHDDYGARRFRCRAGHTFSLDGMLLGKHAALEKALWAAVVALEEQADLTRQVMKRLEAGAHPARLERYQREVASAGERAGFLRELITELVREASATDDEADRDVCLT